MAAQPANALCLDPNTQISGYVVPLAEEIHASEKIAIGKVLKALPLQEDRTDPEGITAYEFTVKVLRNLKGRLPARITVRVENDSSRYPLSVGEKHLLFLNTHGKRFSVNSCGNSSLLPQGVEALKQVEAQLHYVRNAP